MPSDTNERDSIHCTPGFNLPASAQPQRSLFGGAYSEDAYLQPYTATKQEGDDEDQDGLKGLMQKQGLIDNDISDDATYEESDDVTGSDDSADDQSVNYRRPKTEDVSTVDGSIAKMEVNPSSLHSSPPPLPYRPNRFRGHSSTWRNMTASERLIIEAMEMARSRDLAAHLYNAFALRRRAHIAAEGSPGGQTVSFVPPRSWTAWPVSADKVPRVDEYLYKQNGGIGTVRIQADMRPSAELEESIIAIILKEAKERFEAREWMSEDLADCGEENNSARSNGSSVAGDIEAAKDDHRTLDGAKLRPVVQADDDKSRQQLRPLARNVLTQLDRLFLSLHYARRGAMGLSDSPDDTWVSDTENVAPGASLEGEPRMCKVKKKNQARKRKRTRRSRQQPTTGNRSVAENRLNLRDWSDVIGIASMIGWPPAVVSRAAERCAGLFGEDMAFETLKEGKVGQVQAGEKLKWEYVESESETEKDNSSTSPQPDRQSVRSHSRARSTQRRGTPTEASSLPVWGPARPWPTEDGGPRKLVLVCPIKICHRHEDGFSRRWNLNQHMKRMHPNYRPAEDGK